MKTKLITSLLILVTIFMGCSDDNSVTDPTWSNDPSGTVTLSGDVSGSFDAEIGFVNAGDAVAISLANEDGSISIVLSSSEVKTGTFSIPDGYTVLYHSDSDNNIMSEFHTGSVKIDEISGMSISGSFSGSGYPLDMTTFTVDSTKIINASGTFSL